MSKFQGLSDLADAAAEQAGCGTWETHDSIHAERSVSHSNRRDFAMVAEPSRRHGDYGRAVADFIASADPDAVRALLNELAEANDKVSRVESLLSHHAGWDSVNARVLTIRQVREAMNPPKVASDRYAKAR